MAAGIDPELGEIEIEIWPARQKGGQHVGPGPQGVRVKHIASGCIACCDAGRSQHVNLMIAKSMIEAAITHPRYNGRG